MVPSTTERTAGFHHFAIKVRDLAAAESFYCGVLGLTVIRRWPGAAGGGERSLWLDLGDAPASSAGSSFLALETLSEPATAAAAAETAELSGHHLLALRIHAGDRAAWEARLAAAGVAVTHRTSFTIYFRDPEGNRLGLSHHPQPVPAPSPG